jgi:hypothetical protein
MSEDLAAVLKRIASGNQDEVDIQALLVAIQQKQVALVTGERAVALGGNASDAIIVTGDNNIVFILKGEKADEIERVVQGRRKTQYLQDTVYSTFFPVLQMPQYIYGTPCNYNDSQESEAKQAIIPPPAGGSEIYPFLIRNGMLFCFQDLSFQNGPFRELIRKGRMERYDAIDWWDEPDRMHWYVSLLNRSLNKLTGRKGLNLDKEHRRYYFAPEQLGQTRRVSYRPLNQSISERNVVWQPVAKKTGNPRPYWLHRAVALKFHRVASEQWCLSIRPEMRVTKDGSIPLDSDKVGSQVTRKKSRMYNYDLLGEVNFWRDFLSGSKPKIILPFSKTQKIIISTSMMQSEVNWLGIPEEYAKPFKNVDYEADPFDEDEMTELSSEDDEYFTDWKEQNNEDSEDLDFDDDSIPF